MSYELVNGVWVPKQKGGTAISIYLDESADEKQESVYVVAGFIGAEDNWKDFAHYWNRAMSDHGLDGVTFHMNPFEHGKNEPWKSLKEDTERRMSLLNKLLYVIRMQAVFPFGAMTLLSEYNKLKDKRQYDRPYKVCLETALSAAETLCEVAPGGRIRFVCDENHEMRDWIGGAFEKMKARRPELREVFGELVTSTDDASVELCAADLLAFELRKHVYNSIHHPEVPIRYPMKRITEDGPFQFWKCDFTGLIEPRVEAGVTHTPSPSRSHSNNGRVAGSDRIAR